MSPKGDIVRTKLLKHELELRKNRKKKCSRQYAGTPALKVGVIENIYLNLVKLNLVN